PIIRRIVDEIAATPTVVDKRAWQTVGPRRLTDCHAALPETHARLTIWPSHLFMPVHHSGRSYDGPDEPYASQEWASTKKKTYETLHARDLTGDQLPDTEPSPSHR